MLQIIIKNTIDWFRSKNRWWVSPIIGLFFSLCLPPFNSETHWLLSPFPFLSFIVLIPLLGIIIQSSFKRALLEGFLFSTTASFGQYYWLLYDKADGVYHLIILGTILLSAMMGLFYLLAALLFRLIYKRFSRLYIFIFPAVWVLIDYGRTIGDLAFPWAFLGYTFTPILPLAQVASVTGVWGLTYLIVMGNMLFVDLIHCYNRNVAQAQKLIHIASFSIILVAIALWGGSRMKKEAGADPVKATLLQTNIDQFKWGNKSLDTAFSVLENSLYKQSESRPDLFVGSESALLCFIARRPDLNYRIQHVIDSVKVPLIFGSLHWDLAPSGSQNDYLVYNSAFLAQPGIRNLKPYHKIKLVPFSEAMPFKARFPILSRMNLGGADFQNGTNEVIYPLGKFTAAPFICYESIFPDFVRKRLVKGADLIVVVTNDGWFGKSTGPYHHLTMARMRSIENGVPQVRCANSGISAIIDKYGRITGKTGLFVRANLTGMVSPSHPDTIYSRWGDWFVAACALVVLAAILFYLVTMVIQRAKRE